MNDIELLKESLDWMRRKIENAIEMNQENAEDMEIELEVIRDEVNEAMETLSEIEGKRR